MQSAQVPSLAFGATDEKVHGGTGLGALGANALALMAANNNQHCHRREKNKPLLHKLLPSPIN